MTWLIDLFTFDWQLKKSYSSSWKIIDEFGEQNKRCYYEIYYSKKRNRVKIKTGGYRPKEHNNYEQVVKIANLYIKS